MPYKDKEKAKENKKKYRQENKLKISLYNLKYNSEHPEVAKSSFEKYYKKNRATAIARAVKWNKEHPDRSKESRKKHFQNHPDKYANDRRVRRANKNNVIGGHFTYEEFEELKNKTGNKCLCCGRKDVKLAADHVIPISMQIPHSDEISNIQPLCRHCNCSKGTKIIDYRR